MLKDQKEFQGFINKLEKVWDFGNQKYPLNPVDITNIHNFKKDKHTGAIARHLAKYTSGITKDTESEHSHLFHIVLNAYILYLMDLDK